MARKKPEKKPPQNLNQWRERDANEQAAKPDEETPQNLDQWRERDRSRQGET